MGVLKGQAVLAELSGAGVVSLMLEEALVVVGVEQAGVVGVVGVRFAVRCRAALPPCNRDPIRRASQEHAHPQARGIASPVAIRRGEGAQMKRCRDPRFSPRGNQACRGTFGVA